MDAPGFPRQAQVQLPVVAVASGKGGVGKSSVAVAIARELVRSGRRAGLVDADIAGPDVPRMLGLRRDVPARSVTLASWARGGRGGSGLEAMEVDGLKVASAGFLMAGNQGLALGSDLGDLMLGRLIKETDWREGQGWGRTGWGTPRERSEPPQRETELTMLILGLILLLIGIFLHVPILYTIGIIVLIVGAVLWILGAVGRPIGGRRYWY